MHLAIIGPGLIGRSVALAARRGDPRARITEIDRGQPIDRASGADLIVLATPVDVILDIIHVHADVLRSSVIVDTGSTKRAIVGAARAANLSTFVGGHPMAGAATRGPAHAREDLFDDRAWFLVGGGATDAALARVRAFVESLRAQPIVLEDDGREHDHVMAAVSHLPQLVASTLMIAAADAAGRRLQWAGGGLRDTTRLAASSGEVWRAIVHSNADEIAPLLRATARQLDTLADQLADERAIMEFFARANRARALL